MNYSCGISASYNHASMAKQAIQSMQAMNTHVTQPADMHCVQAMNTHVTQPADMHCVQAMNKTVVSKHEHGHACP